MTEGYMAGTVSTMGSAIDQGDDCAELTAAIIRQTVKDYESVLTQLFHRPTGSRKVRLEMARVELEAFFYSPFYKTLTEVDGGRLIEAARRHAVEKEKAAIRRGHMKMLKDMEKSAAVR